MYRSDPLDPWNDPAASRESYHRYCENMVLKKDGEVKE